MRRGNIQKCFKKLFRREILQKNSANTFRRFSLKLLQLLCLIFELLHNAKNVTWRLIRVK